VDWRWYAVVVLGPAAFSLAVAAAYALLGESWTEAASPALSGEASLALSGEASLALLPLFLLVLFVNDGLGEELAWRGFALPRLLVRHNALVASLILGSLWAAWHLPLIWTEGAPLYQQPVWLLLLDMTAKSVLFTWVFLHTRGSALLATLLHATTHLFAVRLPGGRRRWGRGAPPHRGGREVGLGGRDRRGGGTRPREGPTPGGPRCVPP
jgi:membrane protease YdiL (CAAX protease family)